jgi:hypothetical protein
MSLAKRAQNYWEDEPSMAELFADTQPADDAEFEVEEEDSDDETDVEGKITVQVDDEEPIEEEFSFELPAIPGTDLEDDIADLAVEEEPEEVKVVELDMWDPGPVANLPAWVNKMFQNVPRHSGTDTTGLERVIAYLGAIDKVISKYLQRDLRGEIDTYKLEPARKEIRKAIERTQNRLNKLLGKKKASENSTIIKEAQKITGVHGVMVTVPLIISRAARVCINGMVSGGHDIEDMFQRQVDMYKFDIVQQAELMQLLEDMGYPVRRDRGFLRGDDIDTTSSNNMDWAANYYA